MLLALQEEMRWRKRPLSDVEFRDLLATVRAGAWCSKSHV